MAKRPPPSGGPAGKKSKAAPEEEHPPAKGKATLELRFCFSTKEEVTLAVSEAATGLEVKRSLCALSLKRPYFVDGMKLMFRGRVLGDTDAVGQAGLPPSGTVYVLYSDGGGGPEAEASGSDSEDEDEDEEAVGDAEEADEDHRTMSALVVQALQEVVRVDASLALDVLATLKDRMKAIDPALRADQLDLFDDAQFHSLLFSLISCPGLVQELKQRDELQIKALLPGIPSMESFLEVYQDEEAAQQTLSTCLRALQDMFTTASASGSAMDRLIAKVTEVVATRMTDALLESYNSDEDDDYVSEEVEAGCYGGSSEALTSGAEAAEELRGLRPAVLSLPKTRSMTARPAAASGTASSSSGGGQGGGAPDQGTGPAPASAPPPP